jgi:hypothetical protein
MYRRKRRRAIKHLRLFSSSERSLNPGLAAQGQAGSIGIRSTARRDVRKLPDASVWPAAVAVLTTGVATDARRRYGWTPAG